MKSIQDLVSFFSVFPPFSIVDSDALKISSDSTQVFLSFYRFIVKRIHLIRHGFSSSFIIVRLRPIRHAFLSLFLSLLRWFGMGRHTAEARAVIYRGTRKES